MLRPHLTSPLHFSQAWSSAQLFRGTRSRSWWWRWMEETTRATATQMESTSTTPWSWSNWSEAAGVSSWRRNPPKASGAGWWRLGAKVQWYLALLSWICDPVKEVLQNPMDMDADGAEMQSVNFDSASPGYIHCSADNYNGSFHCSWTRTSIRSTAKVLLVKAKRWGDNYWNRWLVSVGAPHWLICLSPLQAPGPNPIWAGRQRIRGELPGCQLPVRRRAAPHHPHAAHTQLLSLGGLHSGFLPERHWSVTGIGVALHAWGVLCGLHSCFLSISTFPYNHTLSAASSEACQAAQPQHQRWQGLHLELPWLLGEALLLLWPAVPGQGGPKWTHLWQQGAHNGNQKTYRRHLKYVLFYFIFF